MKLIKWFAGFFEDHAGSASSKRAALYIALFYLGMMVKGSMESKPIDQTVLISVCAIIGAAMGFSTAELFKSKLQDVTTTEIKTETKTT